MISNGNPLVTVFTLVYNTKQFTIEALNSIFEQDYNNIELIIIDDFSTDGISVNLVEKWIYDNNCDCTFIKHDKNWGICKSLNQVLSVASGKYIIGCGDDILEKNAISKMVKHFTSLSGNYKIVYGDISFIDGIGNVLINSYFEDKKINPATDTINFSSYLRNTKRFPSFGAMYETTILRELGFYDENLKAEDVDMHLRILHKYKCSFCGHKVGRYRRHSDQMSQKSHDWFMNDRISIYHKWVKKIHGIDRSYIIKSLEKFALKSYIDGDSNTLIKIWSVNSKIIFLKTLHALKISPKVLNFWFSIKNAFIIYFYK